MSVPASQVGQAPTVALPKRFPLVARPGFRSTTLQLNDPTVRSPVSDAVLINCYAELDPSDKQYWIEKRLGIAEYASLGSASQGQGVFSLDSEGTNYTISVFGGNIYSSTTGPGLTAIPYGGSGHALPASGGVLAGLANPVWADVLDNYELYLSGNGGLWVVQPQAAPPHDLEYLNMIELVGSNFTTNPILAGLAWLDGVLYVMDVYGNIWGSNENDPGVWTATTVIEAGGRPDVPVALAQQLEYIIALKSTSGRCFYDAGAAAQTEGVGSNLAWVEGADFYFGCASAPSIQLIDDTLLWLSDNTQQSMQVVRMDMLQVKVISTPTIERLLQASGGYATMLTGQVYGVGIKRGGHRFYALTITAFNLTLVYDLDQEIWSVWTAAAAPYWNVGAVSATFNTTPGIIAQDIANGYLYYLDIDQVYPADLGVPCQVDAYTENYDANTRRRKQLNMMYFVNDQVSGSHMLVRKSDDDYHSWSPFRRVRLDVKQPKLARCGTFRRRALNVRHNAATPFRIKAGDLQMDLGTI